jgi:hypothetical protein
MPIMLIFPTVASSVATGLRHVDPDDDHFPLIPSVPKRASLAAPIRLGRDCSGSMERRPASPTGSDTPWRLGPPNATVTGTIPDDGDGKLQPRPSGPTFSASSGLGGPAPRSYAERWLLGTHHGAVRPRRLQRYLDEFVFRFDRRTAKATSHGFARLIQHAVKTPPKTYRGIVHGLAASRLKKACRGRSEDT